MSEIIIIRANEVPYERHALPPPEQISNRVAPEWMRSLNPTLRDDERGPTARVLKCRIVSSCAGWPRKPTAEELYEALHAGEPTTREKALVSMWVSEAQDWELMDAWMQGVYTLRELVAAMHRCGLTRYWERNEYLAFYQVAKGESG